MRERSNSGTAGGPRSSVLSNIIFARAYSQFSTYAIPFSPFVTPTRACTALHVLFRFPTTPFTYSYTRLTRAAFAFWIKCRELGRKGRSSSKCLPCSCPFASRRWRLPAYSDPLVTFRFSRARISLLALILLQASKTGSAGRRLCNRRLRFSCASGQRSCHARRRIWPSATTS